jgi:hypothetical protein
MQLTLTRPVCPESRRSDSDIADPVVRDPGGFTSPGLSQVRLNLPSHEDCFFGRTTMSERLTYLKGCDLWNRGIQRSGLELPSAADHRSRK